MYPVLTVSNFCKTYKDAEVKINELVIDQQVTIIKGENGCGKSTILRAMANLIKYEGTINIKGKTAYMHEETTFPLDITLERFFNALIPLLDYDDCEKTVSELLSWFHLDDKKTVTLQSLSKGMKTKVNLICCLMTSKDIYLLDEPLNGLDKESINRLFLYIQQHPEKQFIISSHVFRKLPHIDCDVIHL